MEKYINADALQQKMTQLRLEQSGDMDKINLIWQVQDMILQAPTADVQEVVHAHWIDTSPPPVDEGRLPEWFEYTCSACKKSRVIAMTPYCYMCGAKMDETQYERGGKLYQRGDE